MVSGFPHSPIDLSTSCPAIFDFSFLLWAWDYNKRVSLCINWHSWKWTWCTLSSHRWAPNLIHGLGLPRCTAVLNILHPQLLALQRLSIGDTLFCSARCILHIERSFFTPWENPITLASLRRRFSDVRNESHYYYPRPTMYFSKINISTLRYCLEGEV